MRPYLENTQKRVGGVAQGVDPEFKPQYQKKSNLNISPSNNKQQWGPFFFFPFFFFILVPACLHRKPLWTRLLDWCAHVLKSLFSLLLLVFFHTNLLVALSDLVKLFDFLSLPPILPFLLSFLPPSLFYTGNWTQGLTHARQAVYPTFSSRLAACF
jgi:hypothetical protein